MGLRALAKQNEECELGIDRRFGRAHVNRHTHGHHFVLLRPFGVAALDQVGVAVLASFLVVFVRSSTELTRGFMGVRVVNWRGQFLVLQIRSWIHQTIDAGAEYIAPGNGSLRVRAMLGNQLGSWVALK